MKLLLRIFFSVLIVFLGYSAGFADGSRDMYYPGVSGNRAFMVSSAPAVNNPFSNWAAHYVYVRAGETIAVASSAQGIGEGHMRLIAPDGSDTISTIGLSGDIGKIKSREEELLGPGNGYEPFEYNVQTGEEGIWRVEFIPPNHNSGQNDNNPENVLANVDWRTPVPMNKLIAAWDVSVRQGSNNWIKGRVYTHVLQLWLSASTLNNPNGAFYGKNYVLTKDGYVYKVDGNGSHGIQFFYFVNSSGLLNAEGAPSYKSSNVGLSAPFHSPNLPDNELHITHKMFYTLPDVTMPNVSPGAVPGAVPTWLYNEIPIAEITDISLQQIEGNEKYVNTKGVYIEFESDYDKAARYEVVLQSNPPGHSPVRRVLYHEGNIGLNRVFWNGLDDSGQYMPVGEGYPVSVSVALMEGEIHFPYFDMEINPNGIRIDRVDMSTGEEKPAMVYWDDSDITPGIFEEQSYPIVNMRGEYSDVNGHKWGSYNASTMPSGTPVNYNGNYGAHSFGNERAMDTWSYAADMQDEVEEQITVRVADLEVVSVTTDQDTVELESIVTYTVVVRNNGPSDAIGAGFEFDLPEGFTIGNVVVTSAPDCNNAREIGPRIINGETLRSVLDIPNGCMLTYTIRATTGPSVPDATYGFVDVMAGIVRPLGYTDPDATSLDTDKDRPGTAAEECEGDCNNIKTNDKIFLLEPFEERGQLALRKEVRHIDSNGSGFHEVGEELEYTFTIRNIGYVPVSDIYIEDPMLSADNLEPLVISLNSDDETILTYRYTITAADVARKSVENTAWVRGKNPRGFDVKDLSGTDFDNDLPTQIDIDTKPLFHLVKKVINQGTGENGQFTIDDKIVYQFDIRHEGDIPVSDIQITDMKISPTYLMVSSDPVINQTINHTAEYIVTEDDIVHGQVENTAVLFGTDQKYNNVLQDLSGHTFDDDLPTITELAKAPQGVDDSYEMYQGQTGLFPVLDNDMEGSSTIDINSIEIVSNPSLGSVIVVAGKVQYTPEDNYAQGSDSFVYRFRDRSRLYSQDVTVDIVIKPTIPVAVDDFYKVGYNYYVDLKPAKNDYVDQSELLPKTVQLMSYPLHGEIRSRGDGVFEYRPNQNYTGYDSLTYIVQEKNGNWSEEAKIVIESAGFFFPSVITPNGDNKNDTFQVLGTYKFDYVQVEIIDRFGRRIYYSPDYKNDWLVPDNLAEGTYFVTFKGIKANEKPVIRKGTVLIKREQYRGY